MLQSTYLVYVYKQAYVRLYGAAGIWVWRGGTCYTWIKTYRFHNTVIVDCQILDLYCRLSEAPILAMQLNSLHFCCCCCHRYRYRLRRFYCRRTSQSIAVPSRGIPCLIFASTPIRRNLSRFVTYHVQKCICQYAALPLHHRTTVVLTRTIASPITSNTVLWRWMPIADNAAYMHREKHSTVYSRTWWGELLHTYEVLPVCRFGFPICSPCVRLLLLGNI